MKGIFTNKVCLQQIRAICIFASEQAGYRDAVDTPSIGVLFPNSSGGSR